MIYPCKHGITRYCGVCEVFEPHQTKENLILNLLRKYLERPSLDGRPDRQIFRAEMKRLLA